MTTFREEFNKLPTKERNRAIKNTPTHIIDKEIGSLRKALSIGFIWHCSPQGSKFWEDVFGRIKA